MTSSNTMNETTANLIKAINELVVTPAPKIAFKLTYDPETNYVTGCTCDNTALPFIEITREQWEQGLHYKKLQVIDGKIAEVTKHYVTTLRLMAGNRWFTDSSNMLIMGKDRGWDGRAYS